MDQNKNDCLVSVIIVNHNSTRQQLLACTASLENHLRQVSYEIIIVHNGSHAIKLPEFKNIYSENKGFGHANNIAASVAKGSYLLFLNPDTLWLKGDLRDALAALEKKPQPGICGFRLMKSNGTIQPWSTGKSVSLRDIILNNLGFPQSKPIWCSEMPMDTAWVSGAALCIHKSCFDALGGFDESFFLYFEDVDLCKRALSKGFCVFYFPLIEIAHAGGASMQNSTFQKKHYYASQDHYFRKHHSSFSLFFLKLLRFLFH